jgi:hypothetical protein
MFWPFVHLFTVLVLVLMQFRETFNVVFCSRTNAAEASLVTATAPAARSPRGHLPRTYGEPVLSVLAWRCGSEGCLLRGPRCRPRRFWRCLPVAACFKESRPSRHAGLSRSPPVCLSPQSRRSPCLFLFPAFHALLAPVPFSFPRPSFLPRLWDVWACRGDSSGNGAGTGGGSTTDHS